MDINYYKQYEPIDGKWYITKELGKSPYGFVFEVETKGSDSIKSAMKVISVPPCVEDVTAFRNQNPDLSDEEVEQHYYSIVEDYIEELSFMTGVKSCPNIVSYEEYEAKKRTDYIGWDIFIRKDIYRLMNDFFKEKTTQENVIKLGIDICNALEVCREQNMLHGDLKPSNIFVDDSGRFKLGDFGASLVLNKAFPHKRSIDSANSIYTAPEIIDGRRYTAVSDVYSLGIIMYQLLNNGLEPFRSSKEDDVALSVKKRLDGQKLSAPLNADTRLSEIILKACRYYPEDRYQSPGQLKRRLEDLLEGKFEPLYSDEDIQSADEDKLIGDESCKKIRYSKKKKRIILTGIVATFVGVGIICAGFDFHYKSIYVKAERKLKIMRFDEARELYNEIYWYRDSKTMLLKCDFEEAKVLLQNGRYNEAEGMFSVLEQRNYPNAHAKRCECMLARAEEFLDVNNPSSALDVLNAISSPITKTTERQIEETKLKAASMLFEAGEFSKARDVYLQMNETTKVNECSYAIAQKHRDNKDYVLALEVYRQLGNYSDSERKFAETEELIIDENMQQHLFASLKNMVGRYSDSNGYFVEYKIDKDGTTQLECNVPMKEDEYFKLDAGVHYHGTDNKGWVKQWIFEYVSMNEILMYNYNDGKVYRLKLE